MSAILTATQWEIVSRINGRAFSQRQIGWYILPESKQFDQYGEYAADYWTCEAQAGRYPIYAFRDCGRRWHSLGCTLPGVLVSGSWWNKLQPGEDRSISLHWYAHTIAAAVLAGDAPQFELLPEVEAREIRFEYDGKPNVTHGLFCGDEQF